MSAPGSNSIGSATYDYVCTIVGWLDGDTVRLDVDLGFHLSNRIDARLYGVNAPEVHSTKPGERKAGIAAKMRAMDLAPANSRVTVRSHKDGREKFGRWLAEVVLESGQTVNGVLLREGLVKAWDGQGEKPV